MPDFRFGGRARRLRLAQEAWGRQFLFGEAAGRFVAHREPLPLLSLLALVLFGAVFQLLAFLAFLPESREDVPEPIKRKFLTKAHPAWKQGFVLGYSSVRHRQELLAVGLGWGIGLIALGVLALLGSL